VGVFIFREKGLKMPGRGTLSDLQAAIRVDKPINLAWFLSKWEYFSSAIVWVLFRNKTVTFWKRCGR
jgi:hypothetical protein